MTKVAIITRTKDRPVFLKRAIQSVASQIFSDYVHVIVNDGGDRAEVEGVLSELDVAIRRKIKVFHRDKSSNAPDTIFNESIDRVGSDFFVIHDDDDTWHEDFLTLTVAELDNNPELAAAVTRADKVLEEMMNNKIEIRSTSRWLPDLKTISIYRQCADNQFTPIATLFRRSLYHAVGKFDDTLPVVGDWEFGLRLLQEYDASFIDPGYALAHYHHRVQADNSFAAHSHRYYVNKIMNQYLRKELAEGKLGVGYIMNQIKYDRHQQAELVRRVLPKFVSKRMQKKAED